MLDAFLKAAAAAGLAARPESNDSPTYIVEPAR